MKEMRSKDKRLIRFSKEPDKVGQLDVSGLQKVNRLRERKKY
jgi:hypothetical protein